MGVMLVKSRDVNQMEWLSEVFDDGDTTVILQFSHCFALDDIEGWYDPLHNVTCLEYGREPDEVFKWLKEHVPDKTWAISYTYIGFENEHDAIAFKLRWM